jgi:hypothetical protein
MSMMKNAAEPTRAKAIALSAINAPFERGATLDRMEAKPAQAAPLVGALGAGPETGVKYIIMYTREISLCSTIENASA